MQARQLYNGWHAGIILSIILDWNQECYKEIIKLRETINKGRENYLS